MQWASQFMCYKSIFWQMANQIYLTLHWYIVDKTTFDKSRNLRYLLPAFSGKIDILLAPYTVIAYDNKYHYVSVIKKHMNGLQCGHFFCVDCWNEYLKIKIIDEGQGQVSHTFILSHWVKFLLGDYVILSFKPIRTLNIVVDSLHAK